MPVYNANEVDMAPTIPTHRPWITATRAAMLVAVLASVSSVYLALGATKAHAAQSGQWVSGAAACLAADHAQHVSQ